MIDASAFDAVGSLILIITAILVFIIPRRYLPLPFIIAAAYLTLGQQLILFGLNFFPIRILIALGCIRIIIRGEFKLLQINILDKFILTWIIVKFIIYIILYQTMEAFIFQAGFMYNALGLYFLLRCAINSLEDITALFKVTAVSILPLAMIMLNEAITGMNLFSQFGGVPEISEFRNGRVRCQGPFRHPILAGSFGAAMMPVAVALWWQKGQKYISVIGFISATIITISAASSGPFIAYVSGVGALFLWVIRKNMKLVRWAAVAMILMLAAVMKAPFYYIIERVSSIVGGSGWYRSYLIEQTVNNFSDWWLIGTKNSADWMPFHLTISEKEFADITSEYIAQAVNGGLISLVLFVVILVFSFKIIGKALNTIKDHDFAEQFLIWTLGVILFVHMVSFISVSYYDQIIVLWYLLLAMIASLDRIIIISQPKVLREKL